MMEAHPVGVVRTAYDIVLDGALVTTWWGGGWDGPGGFELQGEVYTVTADLLGSRCSLITDAGVVADALFPWNKRWALEEGGREHEFRRSLSAHRHVQIAAGSPIGFVRKRAMFSQVVEAQLPGIPVAVQVFVVAVFIAVSRKRGQLAGALKPPD